MYMRPRCVTRHKLGRSKRVTALKLDSFCNTRVVVDYFSPPHPPVSWLLVSAGTFVAALLGRHPSALFTCKNRLAVAVNCPSPSYSYKLSPSFCELLAAR